MYKYVCIYMYVLYICIYYKNIILSVCSCKYYGLFLFFNPNPWVCLLILERKGNGKREEKGERERERERHQCERNTDELVAYRMCPDP